MTRLFDIACAAARASAWILCTMAVMTMSALGADPGRGETRFVILGDSQFDHTAVFERMIHEVEMLRPEFVVQVGDLIHGYTYREETLRDEWRRFRAQLEPLTATYYPVPGNHDVVTDEAEAVYAEVWGKDRLYYSFDHGPVHGVVLDSWWRDADDRIEPWQREWLEQDLAAWAERNGGIGSETLAGKSVFVFLHSPLWRYASGPEGRADWDAVHEILTHYPVRLVAAGHTHEYVWEERDGIRYVVLNSSGDMRANERGGMFHGFIHVSVVGTDVRCAVVKAGSVLPLDTVDSRDRAAIPRLRPGGGTLRVTDWVAGAPWSGDVRLPLRNGLDRPRVYRLDWRVPFGEEVAVDPPGRWIEIAPGESEEIAFAIETDSAPGPDRMPWLEVSVEETLRTGIVSRDWEARYRERAVENESTAWRVGPPMDAPVVYAARYDLFVPPVVEVPRRVAAIEVDGTIDDAGEWGDAAVIDRFTTASGAVPAESTRVRLCYDDDALYVAAWMEEPDPAGLTADAGPPIPLTWSDDDFELFFDPGLTQGDYVRLFQNSVGTRFNSMPRRVPDRYFDSAYESAVSIGDAHWSIEMRIPWSDLGVDGPPRPGDAWGFNCGRHRPRSADPEFQWSGPLYEPSRYGMLRFTR